MARLFDLSTPHDVVKLGADGRATVTFAVTNVGTRALRGALRVRPLDGAPAGWFTLAGDAERDFAAGFTHQVEVAVAVPAGTPAGRLRLRIDALSVQAPEEDYTEGPPVAVEVAAAAAPPPPKKPFPWLWIVIGLVVALVLAAVLYILMRPKPDTPPTAPPASGPTGTPPPQSSLREFNDPRVGMPEGNLPLDFCLQWGTACGMPAADAYCRQNGMAGGAVDFRMAVDSPPTVVLQTRQVCRDPGCDRITWIMCSSAPTKFRRLNPETARIIENMPARPKNVIIQ